MDIENSEAKDFLIDCNLLICNYLFNMGKIKETK